MRQQIATIAAALAVMLAAACSSESAPVPAPASSGQQNATDGGSEVDRSSAESTALAFARMYAAGDLPHACELANADGRESMGTDCDSQQQWSTTIALAGHCQSGQDQAFHFKAAAGTINRNSDLVVWVNETDGTWWVDAASTPASTESDPMGCYIPSSSSNTGSGADTCSTATPSG